MNPKILSLKFFCIACALVICSIAVNAQTGRTRRTRNRPSQPANRQSNQQNNQAKNQTLRLRVMTYNIHVGTGTDNKSDLARIADVINREAPDLVGLQEVDRGVERTNRTDQIAEIAKLTNMEYAFAPNLDYQGGKYGVAILSKHKILDTEHRLFRNPFGQERRGSLRVEVEINKRRLSFVTTHLDYQSLEGRLVEVGQLLQPLRALQMPVILTGDFNDEPTGGAYQATLIEYIDLAANAQPQPLTFPADKPVKRIDYIFINRFATAKAEAARVIETNASDHLPVVVDVQID